ncbi:MAG: GNAT family N-acetyltransferase [Acidimicrobiia bacterium]
MTEIRALRTGELEPFVDALSGPFGFDLPEDEADRTALLERIGKNFEPERARCAFENGRIVGTLGVFSFTMTVPGGTVPVAGTTQVTVQATHRRRGLLTQMMRAHLDEARERGDAAAALWASDSAIYGRFGYGMGAWNTEIEVDRRHVDLHRLAAPPAPVELKDVDAIRDPAIEVYDRIRRHVPGMVAHSDGWWDRIFSDHSWSRDGGTRARYALVVENGTPTGWTKYRLKDVEGDGHPAQDVIVIQLYAETPGAWSGLWSHVMAHDFGHTIRADLRAIDDPIHSLLHGMRRAKTKVSDGLWFRVLDVPGVLEARTYSGTGAVSFTVHDPLGHAGGSYVLETDGTSTTVQTGRDSELSLDVEDLGALSLGGRSAVQMANAGRISGSDEAVVRLDGLFRGSRAPWSPVIF